MGTVVVVFLFSALSLGCAWEIALLAAQPTRIRGVGWPAVTHTFELVDGSPDALTRALKGLPERSEFGDAVMMMRKGRVALRRQFSARERRFVVVCALVAFRCAKPPLEIESAFAFLEKQIREASEVPSC